MSFLFYLPCSVAVSAPIALNSHASFVPILTGTNFSEWKEQVEFTLGVLDLDLAFLIEKPTDLTDKSSADEKSLFHAWERSNRLSVKFMRMTIANNIKTTLPQSENAKEFMKNVQKRFKTADKSLAGKLMAELTTIRYDGTRTMHDHVIEMSNLAAKLKNLGMTVDESFLVQFILNSLPPQYGPFQIHYNTIKDKWNVNELANMLVQEEGRLKQQGTHVAHLTTQGARKKFGNKSGKGTKRAPPKVNDVQPAKKKERNDKCHFCGKHGHFQKDCIKRQKWFGKKGKPLGFVTFFKSNLTI